MNADLRTRIGFGCGGLFRTLTQRGRQRLLAAAFDAGVRYFDVARMYGLGEAETELGQFIRGRRDQVRIATKFGIDVKRSSIPRVFAQWFGRRLIRFMPGIRTKIGSATKSLYVPKDFSIESAARSLSKSLEKLKVDRLDYFFLHEPTDLDLFPLDLHDWLNSKRNEGVIGNFGAAGFIDAIQSVAKKANLKWPVLQFQHHIHSELDCNVVAKIGAEIVTFGVISHSLNSVSQLCQGNKIVHDYFVERFGTSPLGENELAAILLRAELEAFPSSMVLFSTSRYERIHKIIQRVEELPWDSTTLHWLQRIVQEPR